MTAAPTGAVIPMMMAVTGKHIQSKIGAMFIKAHTVENLPANITLSQKGLKKS